MLDGAPLPRPVLEKLATGKTGGRRAAGASNHSVTSAAPHFTPPRCGRAPSCAASVRSASPGVSRAPGHSSFRPSRGARTPSSVASVVPSFSQQNGAHQKEGAMHRGPCSSWSILICSLECNWISSLMCLLVSTGLFESSVRLNLKLQVAHGSASSLLEINTHLEANLKEAKADASRLVEAKIPLSAKLEEAQVFASGLLATKAHLMPGVVRHRQMPQGSQRPMFS